ncbi:MAG: baseplate J/gp47 family protein, partial [Myxococcota bacterium]
APAGSTWVTATPVAGWLGAANEAAAVVGADLETDAALRARVLAIRAGGSSSSAVGLRSGVLQAAGVTECVVIENDSAVADTEGRPANSVEIVVRGGADADVAAAIWARKPAGLVLTSVVPVESRVSETVFDGNGDVKTVVFSREDRIDVYVEVDYLALPAFPLNGESLIEQALIDFGAALTIGTPVYPPNVEQAIYSAFTEPVFRELVLRIGVTANPSSASEVPTGRAQVADFARDRITFTRLA